MGEACYSVCVISFCIFRLLSIVIDCGFFFRTVRVSRLTSSSLARD